MLKGTAAKWGRPAAGSLRLSRRRLVVAALAATAGLRPGPWPALAGGQPPASVNADAKPVPGGARDSHHVLPGRGAKVSTVDDFDGVVGIAQLTGTGTGALASGGIPLQFNVDNRFMVGSYIGLDGRRRTAAFVEI